MSSLNMEHREFSLTRGPDGAWLVSVYHEADEDQQWAAFKSSSAAIDWAYEHLDLKVPAAPDMRMMLGHFTIYTADNSEEEG